MNALMIYVAVFAAGVGIGMLICELEGIRKELW